MYSDKESLWTTLDHLHLTFLSIPEESTEKRIAKERLEECMSKYLYIVPHDEKFYLPVTEQVLQLSVSTPGFDALKAALAFDALGIYATNLIAQPWRKEYREIKLYNGYYTHNIDCYLPSAYLMLNAIGYEPSETQSKNMNLPDGPVDPEILTAVSRDCLMACVECKIMHLILEVVSPYTSLSFHEIYCFRISHVGDVESAFRTFAYEAQRRLYGIQHSMEYMPPLSHGSYNNGIDCDPYVRNMYYQPYNPKIHFGSIPNVPVDMLVDVGSGMPLRRDVGYQLSPELSHASPSPISHHSYNPLIPQSVSHWGDPNYGQWQRDKSSDNQSERNTWERKMKDHAMYDQPEKNTALNQVEREALFNIEQNLLSERYRTFSDKEPTRQTFSHRSDNVHNQLGQEALSHSQSERVKPSQHHWEIDGPHHSQSDMERNIHNQLGRSTSNQSGRGPLDNTTSSIQNRYEKDPSTEDSLELEEIMRKVSIVDSIDGSEPQRKGSSGSYQRECDKDMVRSISNGEEGRKENMDWEEVGKKKSERKESKIHEVKIQKEWEEPGRKRSNERRESKERIKYETDVRKGEKETKDNVEKKEKNSKPVAFLKSIFNSKTSDSSSKVSSPTRKKSSSSNDDQWQCGQCTYINTKMKDLCEMCASKRVRGATKEVQKKEEIQEMVIEPKQIEVYEKEREITPPEESKVIEGWECTVCTYFNDFNTSICDACCKSRIVGPETSPLQSGGKECRYCTYVNQRRSAACEACGKSLHNSPTYV